jgi:hypothetical protein
MFTEVVHFQVIRIPVPQKSVYSRLGFRAGMTQIKPQDQQMMDLYIQEAADLIKLKGSIRTVPVKQVSEAESELEDGVIFSSRSLARILKGCSQVLLMGATAGRKIMEEISEATASDDLTRAVVLDAVASEMTDHALNWIMSYADLEFRRNSWKVMKKRFSAGYGDFSLMNQRIIFEMLSMDEIGVSITENCILVPEKSVTAIAGIGTAAADGMMP